MRILIVVFSGLWLCIAAPVGEEAGECICPQQLHRCEIGSKGECTCIPKNWLCDQGADCEGGTDERGCDAMNCSVDQFSCANSKCIPKEWQCNGENDCGDDSDELECDGKNCTTDEFQCNNGNCVNRRWQCDGDDDCGDNSDETCDEHSCGVEEFRCQDGACITNLWHCDADIDCEDASDEVGCVRNSTSCPQNHFTCNTTLKCVPHSYVCDGENDCQDESDEKNCEDWQMKCGRDEFLCSGLCINESWRCDGDIDCDDQSDEKGCANELFPSCSPDHFQCESGRCVYGSWRCDGQFDCSDNSDEVGCSSVVSDACTPGQYHCTDGSCIEASRVCDGTHDCKDNSDEDFCHINQSTTTCAWNNGGCSHVCNHIGNGTVCSCPSGYQLQKDKHTCVDFNECQLDGACSQLCTNTDGSYQCSCVQGYQLRPNGRGCKALGGEPFLIFANRVDIRKVVPDRSEYTSLVQGLENAIALDVHQERQMIFWSDVTLDKIKGMQINGSDVVEIVGTGLESAGGIAVDWIHNKLFWTDSGTSRIEVSNLDGSMRRVLIWRDLEKPRAIVTHPAQGAIYWTDWGSTPKIERSSMDGQDRRVLADTSLFWPNGLTIDYVIGKIFWVDAKHHVIECANLDGSQRKTVLDRGLPHPFAITLFEDDMFWTDWHTKSINRANKFQSNTIVTVHSRLHYPMDIHAFHPQRQPAYADRCARENGGCSHLCLPNLTGYSCACPTGFRILPNGRRCTENFSNFLLFSRRTDIRRISFDTDDRSDVVIPVKGLKSAIAVDWDDVHDYIYWSDVTVDAISRARWDGTGQEAVVSSGLESPVGLAIDWITEKLYWTESKANRIEVSNLDGTMRTVLIWDDLDKPRDIVVDPISGYMFWTDWGENAKIERAGMDGSERSVLIDANVTWPNSLAIDFALRRLYWVDASLRRIEFCDLDGTNRKTVIDHDLAHPFGLTIHDDRIYWTDWQTRSIESGSKEDGSDRVTIRADLGDLMDIHMFHRRRPKVDSACKRDNGGCSHLCLLSPGVQRYSCACPAGILLQPNGKTCEQGMSNFLIFSRRNDVRTISLDVGYFADVVVPLGELQNTVAVAVDVREDKVYWSDIVLDQIRRANLNGTGIEDVVVDSLDTVDGIAIDDIERHIYWTDAGKDRIEVADLEGNMRKILIWKDLDSPRAITLLLSESYMFWTDWGREPCIERADMDGNNRRILIKSNLGWPNGIAIDEATSRIIWVDAKTEVIECASLEGENRRVLMTSVPHPYGLTVTDSMMYWTDWQTQSIMMADKITGNGVTVVRDKLVGVMSIHAVNRSTVATDLQSKCGSDNGGCSHLCLPNPTGYTCQCPTGIQFDPVKRSCPEVPDEYLLFAMRQSIRRLSMDTEDRTDIRLPLTDLHNAIALDFDFGEGKLYYTDVYLDYIRRSNLTGHNVETIIHSGSSTMDGLAFDWIAKNLYWTDTGLDVIEVARSDGSFRMTLISEDLDEPRAIAVFPQKGLLFWSDWGEAAKIERTYLDGSSRVTLVNTGLVWPNGLCIDYESEKLFWADAKLDRIETSDLNGKNRRQLLDQIFHPFGLTVHGEYLYITDWQIQGIERVNKFTGKDRHVIQNKLEGLMDVHYVAPDKQKGTNPCAVGNGGCSQLCFFRPIGHTCACPVYDETDPCSNKIPGAEYSEAESPSHQCTDGDGTLVPCQTTATQMRNSRIIYAVVGTVISVAVILVIVSLLIFRRRSRRREVGSDTSLTFADPSYHASSSEVIALEKKSENRKTWLPFKRNHFENRPTMPNVHEERLNNREVASLLRANDSSISHDEESSGSAGANADCLPEILANRNVCGQTAVRVKNVNETLPQRIKYEELSLGAK